MNKSWNVVEALLGSRAELLTFCFSKAGTPHPPALYALYSSSLHGISRRQDGGGPGMGLGGPTVLQAGSLRSHVQTLGKDFLNRLLSLTT